MCQQRLSLGLRLRHQNTAMAVGSSNEAPCDIVAEKRNGRGVAPVAHCQNAAAAGGILRVSKRGLRAKGDVRQIDAVPGEGGSCVWLDTAVAAAC